MTACSDSFLIKPIAKKKMKNLAHTWVIFHLANKTALKNVLGS